MGNLENIRDDIQANPEITEQYGQEIVEAVRYITMNEGGWSKALNSMKSILFPEGDEAGPTLALESRVLEIDKVKLDAYLDQPMGYDCTVEGNLNGVEVGALACLHFISIPGSGGRDSEMNDERFQEKIDTLFAKQTVDGVGETPVDGVGALDDLKLNTPMVVSSMTSQVTDKLEEMITDENPSVEIKYNDQLVTMVNGNGNEFVGETSKEGITIDVWNLTKNVSDINQYFTDTALNVEDYFEIVLANENADFQTLSQNGKISEKGSFQASLEKEQDLFPNSDFPETKLLLTEALKEGGSDADGGGKYGATYKLLLNQYKGLEGKVQIDLDGSLTESEALVAVNALTNDELKLIRSGFINEEVGGGTAGNRMGSTLGDVDNGEQQLTPETTDEPGNIDKGNASIDLPVLSFMPGLAGNPKITGMLRGHFDAMETKMDALRDKYSEYDEEVQSLVESFDDSNPIDSMKRFGAAMVDKKGNNGLSTLGEVFHKVLLELITIVHDGLDSIRKDITELVDEEDSDLNEDQKNSLQSVNSFIGLLSDGICDVESAIYNPSDFGKMMNIMSTYPMTMGAYLTDKRSETASTMQEAIVPWRNFNAFESGMTTSLDLNNSQALNYISNTETAQGMVDQLGQFTDTHTVAEINGESIYFNNAYLEESGYGKETNGKMEVNTDKYDQLLLADMETSKEGIGISVNELVNALYENTNTTILLKDDMRDASDPDQLNYINRIYESDMEGKIDGFTEGVKEDDLDGADLLTGTTPSEIQEKREGLLSRKVDYTIVGSVLSPKITTLQPIVKVLHDGKKVYMHAKDFAKTMKKYDDTMKGGEKRRQLRNDKVENERLQINYTKYIGQKFGIDKKYDIQPKVKGETFSNILELTDNDGGVLEIHVNLPNTTVSIPGVNKDFNGCSFELTKETGNETIDRSLKLQKEYKSLNARWTKLRHEGAQLPAELTDKIVFLEKNDRSLVTGEWNYVGVDRAEYEGKRVPDGFSILDMKA